MDEIYYSNLKNCKNLQKYVALLKNMLYYICLYNLSFANIKYM